MMMAVVHDYVVVCFFKHSVPLHDSFIPFIVCVLIVVENQVLERRTKRKFSVVHGASANKIINSAIWFADASVSNERKAARDTRKWGPYETEGVTMVLRIDFHLDSEFILWLHDFKYELIISDIKIKKCECKQIFDIMSSKGVFSDIIK